MFLYLCLIQLMTKLELPHTLNTLIWQLAECKCSVYSPFSFCLKVSICTRKGTPFSPPCFRGVNSVLMQCTWQNKSCAHLWRQLKAVQIRISDSLNLQGAWTWGFGSSWETKRGRRVQNISISVPQDKTIRRTREDAQRETASGKASFDLNKSHLWIKNR